MLPLLCVRHLLETCKLEAVLDMPQGTFLGAGVKTVVLFFTKGEATRSTWYYQLNPGRNMGKTNPLNDADLKDFVQSYASKPESEQAWNMSMEDVDTATYDLSVKNPNKAEEAPLREPTEIIDEMITLDEETSTIIQSLKELV